MMLHACIYAVFAFAAASIINSTALPDILSGAAAASAFCGYYVVTKLGWLIVLKNPIFEAIARGCSVTLAAHFLIGPILYLLFLISGNANLYDPFDSLLGMLLVSAVSLMVAYVTLPLGATAGLFAELFVTRTKRKNDTSQETLDK